MSGHARKYCYITNPILTFGQLKLVLELASSFLIADLSSEEQEALLAVESVLKQTPCEGNDET